MKNKFDTFAEELGWEKPYIDIPLFYKKGEDISTVAFSIADIYESYNKEDVTKGQVNRAISTFSHNKFKDLNKHWTLPLFASDYYTHSRDYKMSAMYAKKALEMNSNLTKGAFIKPVYELL